MKKLLFILSTCLFCASLLPAQTVKDLEKQRKQTLEQLEETGKMLKQTKRNETATINKLNLIGNDIRTRKKLINTLNHEITALEKEMHQLSNEKSQLENELDSLKLDYAKLIRQTHYADLQQQPLLFLLSAKSFQQLYRRVRYLQEYASYRKLQAEQIRLKQADIDTKNLQLKSNRESKQDVLKTRQREQSKLTSDENKQKQMLKNLQKEEQKLLAQQKKQQKKADELNRKIDQLIQKEVKRTAKTLTKEEKLVAGGFEKNKGKLPWPTEKGFVSGEYGVQAHPTLAHVKVNNKGIYIQTTAGSVARSVYEGVVSAIFVSDGKNVVIVQHGNYRTVYSNLTTLYVKQGEKVSTKQRLGKIFTDAEDDNKTEIFFQIRKDTDILNPSLWLSR